MSVQVKTNSFPRLRAWFDRFKETTIEVKNGFVSGRFVAWELFISRLAESRQAAFFGLMSLFLPPLAVAAWATLIRHAKVINVPEVADDLPYPAFVLLSMMLWMTFTESIMAPLEGVVMQLRSLAHANYPIEAVTLARLGEVIFHFLFKLILIIGAGIWFKLPVSFMVIFAPIALLFMILFGMGIGLTLAPFHVLYRDVGQSLNTIITFWLFLTPVFFPVPTEGAASWLFALNPVTPLLSATRELATIGWITQPLGFVIMVLVSAGLFLFGCVLLRRSVPILVEQADS
ncbi:ABC transporter permease [bacterium]|nr:ABC transporter permease [bacterium]